MLTNEIQILPLGTIKHAEGSFKVTPEVVEDCIRQFESKANDLVVDYEHQTQTGKEAPAAGWIKKLHNRGAKGLWATVEWTARATERLKNGEYRYLSPVVLVSKATGQVKKFVSAALTNLPQIDGMAPVLNKSILQFKAGEDLALCLPQDSILLGSLHLDEEVLRVAKMMGNTEDELMRYGGQGEDELVENKSRTGQEDETDRIGELMGVTEEDRRKYGSSSG